MVTLSSTFLISAFLLSIHEFFRRNYPKQYDEFVIRFSYGCIYCFSSIQLQFIKLNRVINTEFPQIKQTTNDFLAYFQLNTTQETSVEFIQDGDIFLTLSLEKLIYFPEYILEDCDFLVISKYANEDTKVVTKIIDHSLSIFHDYFNHQLSHQTASYKLIMSEVKIGDTSIPLQFTTDEYNYLVIGNVLDANFICYFLKKYHSEMVRSYTKDEIMSYHMKIIDENVNILEISSGHKIEIRKEGIYVMRMDMEDTVEAKNIAEEKDIKKEENTMEELEE